MSDNSENTLNPRLPYLVEKANKLPVSPGVYQMKNKAGKIIYIGKAKILKNRVSSYFHRIESHNDKTAKLVENIHDFDFIVTNTELEALVLECSLIKQNAPKYNILLKDDKGFKYIKISNENYPRITYSLHMKDTNAKYIGPYVNDYTVNHVVTEVNKVFKLATCTKKFPSEFNRERPCLNFHIKQCMGVCKGDIDEEYYQGQIKAAIDYIKSGSKASVRRLTAEMNKYAENLDFERAAYIRDQIKAIEKINTSQNISANKMADYDLIALAPQNASHNIVSIAVIMYRGGRLSDKENHFISDVMIPEQQIRGNFLTLYYSGKDDIPREIYIDGEIEDIELTQEFLKEKSGHAVRIIIPQRGDYLKQIMIAKNNASEYLAMRVGRTSKGSGALEELGKLLGLDKTPEYIEAYDISNLGETNVVGGMVAFRDGKPYKSGYRKFAVKEVMGQNDYACMQEVIRRRFTRYLGGDSGFKTLPDLILLDGGKGHVSAVQPVLDELGIEVPLFGMVKDDKHRTRAITKSGGEISISTLKNVFALVTKIQDEVHRFSIDYQRQSHKRKSFELELTKVKGIGEARALMLIKAFKTKKALKNATADELAQAAGVNAETAAEVYKYIQENF